MASPSGTDNLPRPRQLPVTTIRVEASQRATSIFNNLTELKELLKFHGHSFEKRWLKNKSSEQKRIEVLKSVLPSIPPERLLEPRLAGSQSQNVGDAFRLACLTPTLNLSDLVRDDVVLESTYHRANNNPCDFIRLDLANTSIEIYDYQPSQANSNFRMMLFDQRKAQDYGTVLTASASDRRYVMSLEIGLLVLEIQDFIYDFHLRLFKAILAPDFEQLVESPKGPMTDIVARMGERWPSLPETSFRTSYKPPGADILAHLESLASAQRADHIERLADVREDPKSLLEAISGVKTIVAPHTFVLLAARLGKGDPVYVTAIKHMLSLAMEDVLIWNYITCQFRRLVQLEQDGELYHASGGFTEMASTVFQTLEAHCNKFCQNLSNTVAPKLPPVGKVKGLSAKARKLAAADVDLGNLTQHLQGASRRSFNGMTAVASEIQKFINDSPYLLSSMSETRQRAFRQFSLLAELQRHLQLLKPTGFLYTATSRAAAKDEKYWVEEHAVSTISRAVISYCTEHHVNPADTMFQYSSNLKTDLSRERHRDARMAVDALWRGLDRELGHDSLEPLELPTSPDWYDHLEQRKRLLEGPFVVARQLADWNRQDITSFFNSFQRQDVKTPEELNKQSDKPLDPREELPPALECLRLDDQAGDGITTDAPRRFTPAKSSEKHKTRGVAIPVDTETEFDDQQPEQEQAKIKVDKKSRRLLQIAFKCYKGKPPGEIEYKDLLHLMRELGFEPRPNANGHSFHHRNEPIPVSLHRPHGESADAKLQILQFYKFAGQLKQRYGWFGKETYELED